MISSRWIALLAYEGRVRHAADRRRRHAEAVRLASIRSRVLAHLRCAIALDIEGFVAAVEPTPGIVLTCRNGGSPEGFVVRLEESIGSRRLSVDLDEETLRCRYHISRWADGGSFTERSLAIQMSVDGTTSAWTEGVQRVFATVDVLSAFLLGPILERGPAIRSRATIL